MYGEAQYVAGHCDYVVRLSMKSIEHYDVLSDRVFTANPMVKRVDSLVVMKKIKTPPAKSADFTVRSGPD